MYGLAHGRLSADVDLHLSFYNPNRFTVRVEHIKGTILYKNERVATLVYDKDILFPAGSITDAVLLTHFSPSAINAIGMYQDHMNERLLLDVHLSLRTGISLFKQTMYAFNTTYVMERVQVDVPDSRMYCKCKGSPSGLPFDPFREYG